MMELLSKGMNTNGLTFVRSQNKIYWHDVVVVEDPEKTLHQEDGAVVGYIKDCKLTMTSPSGPLTMSGIDVQYIVHGK